MENEKPWKTTTGAVVTIVAFVVTLLVLLRVFGPEILGELPALLALGVPLALAWVLAVAAGEHLMTLRRSLALATACLLVAAPPVYWQWEGAKESEEEGPPEAEEVLFKYEASFTYLSSVDNKPIESDLFLVFPCPIVDNRAAVNVGKQIGQPGGHPIYQVENLRWQLWGPLDNGFVLEVDNGNIKQLVGGRESFPDTLHPTWIENTSHGPKIWLQFSLGLENSFYQGEMTWIKVEFMTPLENENEVTLVDNQGGVYAWYSGYSDGLKEINGEFWVRLSKRVDENLRTVEEFSGDVWNLIPGEWYEYELDPVLS